MQRIAVVGAGAWGTALAIAARRAERQVTLWARDGELANEIAKLRENQPYLPGIALPPEIEVTHDLARLGDADVLLLACPAQALREIAGRIGPFAEPSACLVVCAKGIEQASLALMSEVLADVLPGWPLAVLSGPTFAREVAEDRPTAVAIAAADPELARALAAALGSRRFRPYHSNDPVGAQIGGAVKNVIAIACGIVAGRGLGENARAALIARGLAEIVRLGLAKGAEARSLMGLAGLGDLTLTCTALQSRNYSLGVALGEGGRLDEILGARRSVAEGVHSAAAAVRLAQHLEVDVPICQAVDEILNRGVAIDQAIEGLLRRPLREEQN